MYIYTYVTKINGKTYTSVNKSNSLAFITATKINCAKLYYKLQTFIYGNYNFFLRKTLLCFLKSLS